MPNPFDIGSARFLEAMGAVALGTTSAGLSFSLGRPDHPASLAVDEVLDHVRDLVRATPLPVSADFQAGYADDIQGLMASCRRCAALGVAGLSIEDATGDPDHPLFDLETARARVRAACAAVHDLNPDIVVTARTECFLVGRPDRSMVEERLLAYSEAGADCLFAPGITVPDDIGWTVECAAPKPVNVLIGAPSTVSLGELDALGVRRISVGSALSRVTWGAFARAAEGILAGQFEAIHGAASFDLLNGLFAER